MIYFGDNWKEEISMEDLSVVERNFLCANLLNGGFLIKIPEEIGISDKEPEKYKKMSTYKVGFLYDLLSVVYPDMTVAMKFKIISEKYHLFLGYRRLSDIYKEYRKSKDG